MTATQNVLARLLAGERLTVKSAQSSGTTELRSLVCKLRKKGHDIKTRRVPGEVFNEYWICES